MQEAVQKNYVRRRTVLDAFEKIDERDIIATGYEDIQEIITELTTALENRDMGLISKILDMWRDNNSRFMNIAAKQYKRAVEGLF